MASEPKSKEYTDFHEGKGFGYKNHKDGTICMIRCFKCGRENYAPAVAGGRCAWCRYDPNKPPFEPTDPLRKIGL